VTKVLVAGSLLWPNVARLCRAFRDVGFEVSVVALAEHPVHETRAHGGSSIYLPRAPVESLRQAIATHQPDIVIPCDDRIVSHLSRLRASGDADLAGLIETSIGLGAAEGVVSRRATLGKIRTLPDVRVPRTDAIASVAGLRDWARRNGLPAVLKLDGSWGGRDVIRIRRESQLASAFLSMRLRQSALRGVKRFVFERDVEALNAPRGKAAVTVQAYVPGRPANVAIACWKGELLACIAVETLQSASPFGRSTVVRVVDGEAMVAAARAVSAHFQLSGIHGLDFVIDESGRAHLIEINPRATQTAHLPLGAGRDLPAALMGALSGNFACRPAINRHEIALFPQEWQRDRASPYLSSAFHDLPLDDPELERWFGFDRAYDWPRQAETPLKTVG